MYDYQQALERSRTSLRQRSGWEEIHLAGQQWVVLPEVFSPAHTNSTRAHLDLLHEFLGGSFLEIGSGAGVIAVSAAQAGCDPVYATDISAAAVVNSRLNAERHGVARQVTCVHGDLFDALPTGLRFDVVYWHSSNVLTPQDLQLESVLELAYVDPGYQAHQRFIGQARSWLTPSGRALLAVSSRAERPALDALAAEHGVRLVSVAARTVPEPEGPVTYEVLELTEVAA